MDTAEIADIEMSETATRPTASILPSTSVKSTGYAPTAAELEEYAKCHRDQSSNPDSQPNRITVSAMKLPNFSSALDRAKVSDRMGALLATSLLMDLKLAGINTGVILDRNKIQRERAKSRKKALAAMKCQDLLKCISFDGKREYALKQVMVNGVARNIKELEEHITMIKEPGSAFIGYATPPAGDAETVLEAMAEFLENQEFSTDHLVALLCDGTPLNTGNMNGIMCRFERFLGRPLQWLVCLYHFNELPFRALVKDIVGKPTGPSSFPGEIGKEIHTCETMPVMKSNIQRSFI